MNFGFLRYISVQKIKKIQNFGFLMQVSVQKKYIYKFWIPTVN